MCFFVFIVCIYNVCAESYIRAGFMMGKYTSKITNVKSSKKVSLYHSTQNNTCFIKADSDYGEVNSDLIYPPELKSILETIIKFFEWKKIAAQNKVDYADELWTNTASNIRFSFSSVAYGQVAYLVLDIMPQIQYAEVQTYYFGDENEIAEFQNRIENVLDVIRSSKSNQSKKELFKGKNYSENEMQQQMARELGKSLDEFFQKHVQKQ
jgi:hypothetical protein